MAMPFLFDSEHFLVQWLNERHMQSTDIGVFTERFETRKKN